MQTGALKTFACILREAKQCHIVIPDFWVSKFSTIFKNWAKGSTQVVFFTLPTRANKMPLRFYHFIKEMTFFKKRSDIFNTKKEISRKESQNKKQSFTQNILKNKYTSFDMMSVFSSSFCHTDH